MSTAPFLLVFRGLLLLLSFCGLCATIRSALKVNRFIAPFVAACGIISVLMLCGMLHILQYGFFALYIAGFAGCAYTYCIRRVKPDLALIGLLIVFTVYLVWRFYPCPLERTDDVSHWGLVARHLLESDAFPDASTPIVAFQSYPLGSASFIYYICRTLDNHEGLWLVAQNLLMGLLFLPMLAHIENNKKALYPIAGMLFLFLFTYHRVMVNLQVDWLLAFFGIGMIAAAAYYRSSPIKAFWISVPALIAVVYVKNSGMYFALWTILLLTWIARRSGMRWQKQLAVALGGVALFVGAYLLWTLHVKLSFSAGLNTKHAFSPAAYAAELSSKDPTLIAFIAKEMALRFLFLRDTRKLTVLVLLICTIAALLLGCRRLPGRRGELRCVRKALAVCMGMYLLWYVLLFFMYLFSMPAEEAWQLASYARYTSTGVMFMLGAVFTTFLAFFGSPSFPPLSRRLAVSACALGCAALLVLGNLPRYVMYEHLTERVTQLSPIRQSLQNARTILDLPEKNCRVLVYFNEAEDGRHIATSYYNVKYEYKTTDVRALVRVTRKEFTDSILSIVPCEKANAGYACVTHGESYYTSDPMGYIAQYIDDYDAFILLDYDAEIEALTEEFLASYDGDTPVVFAYREGA